MPTHIAKRKDHRCDDCGRRIPLGHRYWTEQTGHGWLRTHTNCELYTSQDLLPPGYNHNRRAGR